MERILAEFSALGSNVRCWLTTDIGGMGHNVRSTPSFGHCGGRHRLPLLTHNGHSKHRGTTAQAATRKCPVSLPTRLKVILRPRMQDRPLRSTVGAARRALSRRYPPAFTSSNSWMYFSSIAGSRDWKKMPLSSSADGVDRPSSASFSGGNRSKALVLAWPKPHSVIS